LVLLQRPDFLRQIGRNDYWYNRNDLPELRFPYMAVFCKRSFWSEVIHGKRDDISPREGAELWAEAEPTQLMLRLFDRFADDVRQQHAIPIIVLLGRKPDVLTRQARRALPVLTAVLPYCEKQGILCFNGIDALAEAAASPGEVDGFFRGHLSPKGNELLATKLRGFLREHGLADEGSATR
jgi:hypothetical protein